MLEVGRVAKYKVVVIEIYKTFIKSFYNFRIHYQRQMIRYFHLLTLTLAILKIRENVDNTATLYFILFVCYFFIAYLRLFWSYFG